MLKPSLQKIFIIALVVPLIAIAQQDNKVMNYRSIQQISQSREEYWVGDGFPVKNMFSYSADDDISPFLLLDYAKPIDFAPSNTPRGVGQHPHRGFETVTIVYDGELQHKDTAGNHGKIGPGDVQWMTAARGILHEEKHSDEFTKNGGRLEMVQLWVNLPAKYKMSPARYQELTNANIPSFAIGDNLGLVRVIAGNFNTSKSNVKTFSPVHLYDIRLTAGAELNIPVTDGYTAMLLVLDGKVAIENKQIKAGSLVKFTKQGDAILLTATRDSKVLFMAGEPINEPVVGSGPFVMNTEAEIKQAFSDYREGKLQSPL